jgi:hypothetical protein
VGTLSSLAVTGNITAGNANLGNSATANFYIGNGSLLTGITAVSIANGNSNVSIPAANGNINFSAAGNANIFVLTGNGAVLTGNLQTGNGTGGNITGANIISSQTMNASSALNVSGLSNLGPVGNVIITGGSSGQVLTTNGSGNLSWTSISADGISNGNSNVSIAAANGNVTISAAGNANIVTVTGTGVNVAGTSNTTGNIAGGGELNISGNAVFGGNLTVNGNLVYVNVTDLSVSDPIIQLQTGPNGAAPTSNSGKDVGTALNYYDTSAKIAWMGWDTSNAEIAFGANVGISSEVVSFTQLANIRAGNANLGNAVSANFFIGNGSQLTGITAVSAASIANGNSNVTIPAANGNVNISASGNSNVLVVTGTGINVTGNVAANSIQVGNGTGGNVSGVNVLTANTANFSAALNVTGVSNLGPVGNVTITGGTSGQVLTTNGSGNLSWTTVSTAIVSNGNSNVNIPAANGNVNISAAGNANIVVVTGTGVNVAGNMSVTGNVTAGNFVTSGSAGNISGANVITACTFIGNTGNFSTALNVTGTSNLGPVGNVTITGGSNGQYLQTNGSGVLSWATISTSSISNGNSNVNIPAANGNVNISAAGNANIVVITGTGANITGTLNVTGNANAGNIGATGGVFTTVAGSLTTAAQPNITSVGTLSSLAVTGNITSGNASLGNLVTANFFSGVLTTAAQPNITSIGTLGSLAVTGNITAGNANLGNAVTANFYVGNGSLLTGITVSSVSNGNSNLSIPAANGNVNISAAGNANILVVTGTGANITGSLGISSNLAVTGRSNLGAVGNVVITGGTANYVLSTDGAGNLSWVAQSGGGGNGTPGGANTQVQFNDANSFAGNAGFTFNKTTTTVTANNFVATSTANLGAVGNVTITGGTNGLVLVTNGSGGLSWGNVGTAVTVDDFIGSGSQTAFTLTTIPSSVDYTLVSIAGTFQPRSAYSLAGNVLTFTSAPPAAAEIEVTTLAAATYAGPNTGTFINRTYTGDGANANFTVTNGVTANSVIVTENGIVQAPGTDYTVSGANLTFTSAPANSVIIGIREIPAASAGGGSTWANASANVTASANTKYILNTASTAITVTLPAPSFGMEVGVIDGTGNANVNTITVYGNGANIQGSNANMTVNTSRAAFTLVYYNSAQGWLLTNV